MDDIYKDSVHEQQNASNYHERCRSKMIRESFFFKDEVSAEHIKENGELR